MSIRKNKTFSKRRVFSIIFYQATKKHKAKILNFFLLKKLLCSSNKLFVKNLFYFYICYFTTRILFPKNCLYIFLNKFLVEFYVTFNLLFIFCTFTWYFFQFVYKFLFFPWRALTYTITKSFMLKLKLKNVFRSI